MPTIDDATIFNAIVKFNSDVLDSKGTPLPSNTDLTKISSEITKVNNNLAITDTKLSNLQNTVNHIHLYQHFVTLVRNQSTLGLMLYISFISEYEEKYIDDRDTQSQVMISGIVMKNYKQYNVIGGYISDRTITYIYFDTSSYKTVTEEIDIGDTYDTVEEVVEQLI